VVEQLLLLLFLANDADGSDALQSNDGCRSVGSRQLGETTTGRSSLSLAHRFSILRLENSSRVRFALDDQEKLPWKVSLQALWFCYSVQPSDVDTKLICIENGLTPEPFNTPLSATLHDKEQTIIVVQSKWPVRVPRRTDETIEWKYL
jgi:hypothetical protein